MRTETEIRYELVDATAAADGALSATSKQPFVDLEELHDHTEGRAAGKWATLEDGAFVLDGTFSLFPDDPAAEDMGLWSQEQSDAGGVFGQPPMLTATFSHAHTSLGLTLTFCEPTGDWCKDLHIDWYGADGGRLAEADLQPDSACYFCDKLVQNYYKITLTFRKTNKPHRFLKLFRIDYGLLEHLTGARLTEAALLEEADPVSLTVRVNTLCFGFYADRRFDLLDMTGVYSVFQQQQRVRVRQVVDGVSRDLGLFFTDVPTVENQRAVTIDCIDWVGVMEQTDYMGGLWADGIAAGDLLGDIMRSAGIADYEIAPALAATTVKGYLPICTHRAALQQLAFAIGGMVSCARSDTLRLVEPPSATRCVITPLDKVAGHRQEQRPYVSGVEIYTHHYAPGESVSELFRAACKAGVELVRLGGPADDLSCTGAAILESGVNYARLHVTTAGTVTLTGRRYEDQMSLGGSVYTVNLPAGARASIKTVEDATLTADAQAAAQRLYAYYQRRVEDTGDLFPVAAAAGDLVALQAVDGKTLTGVAESMDLDLTGGGITRAVIAGG